MNKINLIQYLIEGIKKNNQLRIGVEHEKFLFNKEDLKRIDFNQIKKVFEILKNNGWKPELEKNKVIGLKRDNQKITTEPGFQYELSGAPFKNIHSVCSENSRHFDELKQVFSLVGITTSSIAYDPFNKLNEIPRSPKERYKIMTSEMPKGGELSLDMMYKTAGIQINYDYTSEEDFEKKFKIDWNNFAIIFESSWNPFGIFLLTTISESIRFRILVRESRTNVFLALQDA